MRKDKKRKFSGQIEPQVIESSQVEEHSDNESSSGDECSIEIVWMNPLPQPALYEARQLGRDHYTSGLIPTSPLTIAIEKGDVAPIQLHVEEALADLSGDKGKNFFIVLAEMVRKNNSKIMTIFQQIFSKHGQKDIYSQFVNKQYSQKTMKFSPSASLSLTDFFMAGDFSKKDMKKSIQGAGKGYMLNPKAYAVLADYFNKKDKDYYGYYPVGRFDNYRSFFSLLNLLDRSAEGTNFVMINFALSNDGLPHVLAIKCERWQGKNYIIVADASHPLQIVSEDIENAIAKNLPDIVPRTFLYFNDTVIQSDMTNCYYFAAKIARKLKFSKNLAAEIIESKLTTDQAVTPAGLQLYYFSLPVRFVSLTSSPDQLEENLNKYAEKDKEKLLYQIKKPRKGYGIVTPLTVLNRNYVEKSGLPKWVDKNLTIAYFREKYLSIIRAKLKEVSQAELQRIIAYSDVDKLILTPAGKILPKYLAQIEIKQQQYESAVTSLSEKIPKLSEENFWELRQSLLEIPDPFAGAFFSLQSVLCVDLPITEKSKYAMMAATIMRNRKVLPKPILTKLELASSQQGIFASQKSAQREPVLTLPTLS